MRVHVEVCASSPAEALAADALGCDTVELCAWIECGGVTPSIGTVALLVERLRCPMRVLVRPVPGGFCYGTVVQRTALADVERLADMGTLRGMVVGALDADNLPDIGFLEGIRSVAGGKELTFHRAVDHARPVPETLARCVDAGIQRVLTSGGAATALEGAPRIRAMIAEARGLLTIAAGAGIRADNVVRVVEATGVEEVHFSARLLPAALPGGAMELGPMVIPDEAKIEGVLNALVKAGLR